MIVQARCGRKKYSVAPYKAHGPGSGHLAKALVNWMVKHNATCRKPITVRVRRESQRRPYGLYTN